MKDLKKSFDKIVNCDVDTVQENANTDGQSPMGMMSKFGSEGAKWYALENLVNKKVTEAIYGGYIWLHDLDFYVTGTTTCLQIPLAKVLKNGFNTGHGHMREPQSISSALALTSIILQANQNQQHK